WSQPAQPQNITRRSFVGVVWCPTTPNQNWFARRRGTTYFTGNTALMIPQDESTFIQAMQLNATQVAAIYGVQPHRVGGTRNDGMTYSNVTMNLLDELTTTLRPWLTRWEHTLTSLLPSTQFVKFDTDEMLRTDPLSSNATSQIQRN